MIVSFSQVNTLCQNRCWSHNTGSSSTRGRECQNLAQGLALQKAEASAEAKLFLET